MTPELACELFVYDPLTGALTWRVARPGKRVGAQAGSVGKKGYRRIKHAGKSFTTSRVIFMMVTGREPVGEVDHRDLDKGNERWGNLREGTRAQNQANRSVRADSKSGVKGIYVRKPGSLNRNAETLYEAYYRKDGKRAMVGRYKTMDAAVAARQERITKIHGEFARQI